MRHIAIVIGALLWAPSTWALPPGPGIICEVWPDTDACDGGAPDCTTCHTTPPARNPFGADIEALIAPGAEGLTSPEFIAALPEALLELADEDADGDGFGNLEELIAGTSPGDAEDAPGGSGSGCNGPNENPDYDVCGYDRAYAFKRLQVDVCGVSPDFEQVEAFVDLGPDEQDAAIGEALDRCLDSEFWLGRDGVLWRLANPKIRPIAALKTGANGGRIPLGNYDHDYWLFTYTQTDDRDARLALTADFFVDFDPPTTYRRVDDIGDQALATNRRAGLLTTRWFLLINTMFTPVPRTTAAQAYRSFLGLDIARSEGLVPPDDEPLIDYDDKGITQQACAVCHTTLDPLSYPFSRYEGISGRRTGTYAPLRMSRFGREFGGDIRDVPEAGYLFGQPVDDVLAWAEVAANSDAFAQATVREYWHLLVGHDPGPGDADEFEALWRAFRGEHDYRVERMLHDLVRTEAYGVP